MKRKAGPNTDKLQPPAYMVILGFAVLLVCCGYVIYRLSGRLMHRRWDWVEVCRTACVIAAVRIAAVWLGIVGFGRSDWLQVWAYLVVMLDLPEIYVLRSLRNDPLRWAILASCILAVTSIAWAAAFVWVRRQLGVREMQGQ
jgi:hypothetical protein